MAVLCTQAAAAKSFHIIEEAFKLTTVYICSTTIFQLEALLNVQEL